MKFLLCALVAMACMGVSPTPSPAPPPERTYTTKEVQQLSDYLYRSAYTPFCRGSVLIGFKPGPNGAVFPAQTIVCGNGTTLSNVSP